jgi:hypothetical protein
MREELLMLVIGMIPEGARRSMASELRRVDLALHGDRDSPTIVHVRFPV